jgi:hypothetical protein
MHVIADTVVPKRWILSIDPSQFVLPTNHFNFCNTYPIRFFHVSQIKLLLTTLVTLSLNLSPQFLPQSAFCVPIARIHQFEFILPTLATYLNNKDNRDHYHQDPELISPPA